MPWGFTPTPSLIYCFCNANTSAIYLTTFSTHFHWTPTAPFGLTMFTVAACITSSLHKSCGHGNVSVPWKPYICEELRRKIRDLPSQDDILIELFDIPLFMHDFEVYAYVGSENGCFFRL
ncbi:hypothetical protein PoB_003226200 [Plakobranchus ocellatus]|uniref:Uncharacterized protein n=1 Tax=Plakobranchus ocellatus TaxID=259542 RepID=A0AAV4AFT2_9GAST|nr:hypothetical protein PoB_003226200 [Plakobranchus ocellatus]